MQFVCSPQNGFHNLTSTPNGFPTAKRGTERKRFSSISSLPNLISTVFAKIGEKTMSMHKICVAIFSMILFATLPQTALGMIRGDKGNSLIPDPGWPKGAAKVFNSPHRIAWWEDPPFGGGRWHSECQGDNEKLSQVIEDLSKTQSVKTRIVVHSGVERSFWLDPNREQVGNRAIEVDWVFVVWQKSSWDFQKNLPNHISALRNDKSTEPIAELHVYTGGLVDWPNIKVPAGIETIDNRLESHGFSSKDGRVVEGSIRDFETDKPLSASVSLESLDPSTGEREHKVTLETLCKASGDWHFKAIPLGQYRIVARIDGYVPVCVARLSVDGQPRWERYDIKMKQSESIRGRAVDDKGHGLGDAHIRLVDLEYEAIDQYVVKSDAAGAFEFKNVPKGQAMARVSLAGFYSPGNGTKLTVPSERNELILFPAGEIQIEVLFSSPRQTPYIVEMTDASGKGVGKWGGSGNINDENQIVFKNIPPGNYLVSGQPNPGSKDQRTETVSVEIVGGQVKGLELDAK